MGLDREKHRFLICCHLIPRSCVSLNLGKQTGLTLSMLGHHHAITLQTDSKSAARHAETSVRTIVINVTCYQTEEDKRASSSPVLGKTHPFFSRLDRPPPPLPLSQIYNWCQRTMCAAHAQPLLRAKHQRRQTAIRPLHLSKRYKFEVTSTYSPSGCVSQPISEQQSSSLQQLSRLGLRRLQTQELNGIEELLKGEGSPMSSTGSIQSTLDLFDFIREPRLDQRLRPSVFQVLCGDEEAHSPVTL
ncbi:hypothetical protein BCR37DRAFT_239327 [Protomyces lactucae-debilis]|uniref:Uncharacterized protein n=1 Tax=Protomyces lactucae-debilis TaxID=2754530 RepID=A0A1Y2FNB2_PROLT|nr:uncharacterized protein BCR37DRAFT_239327 [Protomyces lactucae-debilis]ORY85472.1 hypothetical protein BCR37DRAFT_239327 [Protomyces lactucae-debilis]